MVQNYEKIHLTDDKKDFRDAIMCQLKGISVLGSKRVPGGRFLRGRRYIFSKPDFEKWGSSRFFTKPIGLKDKEVTAVNKDQNTIPEVKKEDKKEDSKSGSGSKDIKK